MSPVALAPDWNPRHDPEFKGAFLTYLVRHPDEFFHPTDLWETSDANERRILREVGCEVVVAARRLGYVIDGDRRRGYCYRRSELPRHLFLYGRAPNGTGTTNAQLPLAEAAR